MDKKSMEKERKRLSSIIKQWNESRLDLFSISLPDERLECHGVMRFYHKDSSNNGKYATKCIRVSSNAPTTEVIEMLSTKFRPDMRMLTKPTYVIYEIHVDGEMRQLKDQEKPLLVQLSWVKDDREGRFLLQNKDDKAKVTDQFYENSEDSSFKLTRNLTKKEKKMKKKQEKASKKSPGNSTADESSTGGNQQEIYAVKQLYSQVPESTFTRTVSNPEAVMKKRREQKLQKRGANILKVYGDRINPEIPYKSLLLLPSDNVTTVIQDALDKYALGKESSKDYRIIQVVLPPDSKPEEMLNGGWGMETILAKDKCPLDIAQKWQPHEGTLVFQLRHIATESRNEKKPENSTVSAKQGREKEDKKDNKKKKTKNPPSTTPPIQEKVSSEQLPDTKSAENGNVKKSTEVVPKFLEFSSSSDQYKEHVVSPNITEIGCDRRKASYGPFIELPKHSDILPSHCVITNMEGIVTVTPQDHSEVFVDGHAIQETTMLSHESVVWLGRNKELVYTEPGKKISVPQIRKKIQATHPRNSAPTDPGKGRHPTRQTQGQKTQNTEAFPRQPEDGRQYQAASPRGHTSSTSSSQSKQSSARGAPPSQYQAPPQRPPPAILPASLQLRNGAEESFLMEVVSVSGGKLHFKLSPAYTLYLSLRDIVEVTPKSSLEPVLVEYLCTTTDLLDQSIQLNSKMASELAFWMANASELLNFVRHDRDVSPCTNKAQDALAKTVQLAFRHLVQCMQRELFQLMPAFMSESDEDLPGGSESDTRRHPGDGPTMYNILHMLSSAMSLLRRCRVNAALTIQLFSQLFHFINMWLFNEVVCKPELGLCCRSWGLKIRARLARVEAWAEKQGLELAADCHLARITQAMHLLQAPKQSAEDIAAISGTCFKLNSLQLRALLSQYRPSEREGESQIPNELIDKVVQVAQNTADELTRSDGREVQLEEDPDLQLPFLLPEDGYSCDVVHSVPSGLTEFARPLVTESLCVYTVNAEASGQWTVHFHSGDSLSAAINGNVTPTNQSQPVAPPPEQPEMATVTFNKHGGGMGLSIVAARGPGQERLGIYIRSVVKGGAAFKDGRLQAGDQLVSVDGHSLVGLTQERAAEIMTKTGQTVTLTVARKAALYHGLAPLLDPSPKHEQTRVQRRPGAPHPQQPRPKSEGYALQQQNHPAPTSQPYGGNVQGDKYSQPQRHHVPNIRPMTQYQNRRESPVNKSTPQLNDNVKRPFRPINNTPQPRAAISTGNLQHSPAADSSKARALDDWQRTWEAKRAQNTYQRNRAKSSSSSALVSPAPPSSRSGANNDYTRRKQVESLITGHAPKVVSPRQLEQSSTKTPSPHNFPSPPGSDLNTSYTARSNQSPSLTQSLDNPNYEHFLPPPPSPPPESPSVTHVSDSHSSQKDSPRDYVKPTPVLQEMKKSRSPESYRSERDGSSDRLGSSQTMGRPVGGRKKNPDVARIAPTQQKASSKSSTLPRHFKSAPVWDVDAQQRAVQEQLNALRDEEIDELSARIDSLSALEKNRLNNLLQEREFQRRVEEENRKIFSEEDGSDDEYDVPDRPDRDRLLRLQDDNAERIDPQREQEERDRREEEREKRKQMERERREKEEQERKLRERLEMERVQEDHERRKIEQEKRQMENEEKRRKEWEEEERQRRQRERDERELREWEEHKQRQRKLHEQEQLQKKQLEKIRMQKDSEARALQELTPQKSEEDAREEAEREFLERKLSQGKPSNFPKYAGTYGTASRFTRLASGSAAPYSPATGVNKSKAVMRDSSSKGVRPVSDGYMLGKTEGWQSEDKIQSSTPATSGSTYHIPTSPPSQETHTRPVSYIATHTPPRVIGSQERYRDPRDRREAEIRREQSMKRRQQEPSFLTFKDRQRLFSTGTSTPVQKPKASKKLLEIQNNLRGEMS